MKTILASDSQGARPVEQTAVAKFRPGPLADSIHNSQIQNAKVRRSKA